MKPTDAIQDMPIDFEDERGWIRDLLVTKFGIAVTEIFTETDGIRGNHYHKQTKQWTYCQRGSLLIVTNPITYSGERQEHTLQQGQLHYSPEGEGHAWKALEPTRVLVFTEGPRAGKEYASDTYPLLQHEKLIHEGWACRGCGATTGRYDNGEACEACVMASFAEGG